MTNQQQTHRIFSRNSQPTDPEKTTMDASKKIATDAQDAINEPASEHSNVSSSNNNSPDSSSCPSQPDKFQGSSKSSETTVNKSIVSTKITETASTMLNVSENANHKSPTLTTNVTSNEEEPRIEISGRIIS